MHSLSTTRHIPTPFLLFPAFATIETIYPIHLRSYGLQAE
jgi:hypothetical protein